MAKDKTANQSDWLTIVIGFFAEIIGTIIAALLIGSVDSNQLSPFHIVAIVAIFAMLAAGIAILAMWKRVKIANWSLLIAILAVGIIVFSIGSLYLFYISLYPPNLTPEEIALTEVAKATQIKNLVIQATLNAQATSTSEFEHLMETASAELWTTQQWEDARTAVAAEATAAQQVIYGTKVANSTSVAQKTRDAAIASTQVAFDRERAANSTAQAAVAATQAVFATQTQIAFEATPIPSVPQGNCANVKPPCNYTVVQGDNFTAISLEEYGSYDEAEIIINYNRTDEGLRMKLKPGDILFVPPLNNLPPLAYPNCTQDASDFPCQHISHVGDTFEIVAQEFYGNIEFSDFLRNQNPLFGLTDYQLALGIIPEGTVIILPIP